MQQVAIHTPQNVEIGFALADVGKRIQAKIIDYFIIGLLFYIFDYLFSSFAAPYLNAYDYWSQIALINLFFLPIYTYSLWFEILLHGQTPGKFFSKIQVLRLDGLPYSWENALVRWMFTLVDLSFFGIIGLISISSTKNAQRIGDIAASTVVVTKSKNNGIEQTIFLKLKEDYKPIYQQVTRLSDNDMRIIKGAFESALRNDNLETLKKLRKKIEDVIQFQDPNSSDRTFIQSVMKDFNYFTNK